MIYHPRPSELETWPTVRKANVHLRELESRGGAVARLGIWLPRVIRRDALDAIHTQYMVPCSSRAHRIITIHDVLFEDFPEFFPWRFRLRSKFLIRLSAMLADSVLTVSEYSGTAIRNHYGTPSEKLAVVANGVDIRRFRPDLREETLYRSLGLKGAGYILSVGRLEARKNPTMLINAYRLLAQPRPQLVIVGQRDKEFLDPILDICSFERDEIFLIDSVSDTELPKIYAGAALFAYTSLAEGFGMPLLEAMASGVPVVSTNVTAMPEVIGDAGLTVEPDDVEGFARAMARVLDDSLLSEKLRVAGIDRVRDYTWESSAESFGVVMKRIGVSREQ